MDMSTLREIQSKKQKISFHPKTITRILLIIFLILCIGQAIVIFTKNFTPEDELVGRNIQNLTYLLDFNIEGNLPTVFSQMLLFFSAIIALVTTWSLKQTKDRFSTQWGILSSLLFLMTLDDGAQLHEKFGYFARWLFNGVNPRPYYVGIGLVVIVLFTCIFWSFFWNLPPRTRFALLMAGALLVGGGILVDLANSWFILEHFSSDSFVYRITNTVEESLEFVGLILLVHTLLSYLGQISSTLSFDVEVRS